MIGTLVLGLRNTVLIVVLAAPLALIVGTVAVAMRVSSIITLRVVGTLYVNIFRNIPLALLLYFSVLVLPQTGLLPLALTRSFFVLAVASLVMYYGTFACEALRSGINAIGRGQGEAARSLGLRNVPILRFIVIPQAARTAVPTLIVVFLQLIRSSAIAGAFGVMELFAQMGKLAVAEPQNVIKILLLTAALYLAITIPCGLLLGPLEKRLSVLR